MRGRPSDSPEVRWSKTLSYVLRHGAAKESLAIRTDGYIKVDDLLARPKFKGLSLDELKQLVAANEKQRFAMMEENGTLFIRANQGHSLKVEDLELTRVTDAAQLPIVIHGTFTRFWPAIQKEGLRVMSRTHIHCAAGIATDAKVISGMRKSCDLYIYIDAGKALADDIPFLLSANGVILTPGKEGFLDPKYFLKVIDKEGRNLLDVSSNQEQKQLE